MTRETKIGMLVGLAFIIVIGILLSDHMTSTNEPQRADQARAGTDVRGGTTTPAAAQTVRTEIPPPSIPTAPLPTQQELAARQQQAQQVPPTVQNIQVGPGGAPLQPQPQTPQSQIVIQQGSNPAQPQPIVIGPGSQPQPQPGPIVITPPPPAQPGTNEAVAVANQPESGTPEEALNRWMQQQNGGAAAQPASNIVPQPQPEPARQTGVPMAAVKQYKAEPGDNLHKMALKAMGVSTKATRDAILNANPSLKANPDKIIVGRTYVIPPAGAAAVTPAPSPVAQTPAPTPAPVAQGPVTPSRPGGPIEVSNEQELTEAMQKVFGGGATNATHTPAPGAADTATADGYRWYTVKENDTLWGIAAEHLGAGSKLNAIVDLNKDIIKDKVTVHPGQKLRLPAKQVASAGQ